MTTTDHQPGQTPAPAYDPAATGKRLVEQLRGIVPEGVDVLDDLTVAELGTIGRQLGADAYDAVKDRGAGAGLKWEALGRVTWLWAKRRDARAKLDPILQLTPAQIGDVLGLFDVDEQVDDEVVGEAGVDVAGELASDPTAPTPESPSLERGDSTPTPS